MFFIRCPLLSLHFFFFFNDTATPEIYPLSLHDALPISKSRASLTQIMRARRHSHTRPCLATTSRSMSGSEPTLSTASADRKSTRLNSSHLVISYAVFCLKKKKKQKQRSSTNTQRRRVDT